MSILKMGMVEQKKPRLDPRVNVSANFPQIDLSGEENNE